MPANRKFSTRDDYLPLCRPQISPAGIEEVVDTLRSGWLTTGPKAARFEESFANYIGVPHALAVSSATAGLHLALAALGVREGTEVVTTSMTWVSTVNMIEVLGGRPVFVDVDPSTLLVDHEQLALALGPRTVGILPVHFAGAPCEMTSILNVAEQSGVWVCEDAAHGAGTRYDEQHVGTLGNVGVFSFHPIKNLTTGEGGVVACASDELERRISVLRFHGLGRTAWDRYHGGEPEAPEVQEPGFKYNFTDIQAALGIHQLAELGENNARRAVLAKTYDHLLGDVEEVQPLSRPAWRHTHAHHLYVIRLLPKSPVNRLSFLREMKARNIGCGVHFRAVHLQRYYAEKYPEWQGRLPRTEEASAVICSLPLFPSMTADDVHYVADAVKDVMGGQRHHD